MVKTVQIKELSGETCEAVEKRVKEEVVHEATIINKLGDHPGLPHLFGICSERRPFWIVMQFHGDRCEFASVTISSALWQKK